jgi:hypothetical protein
MMILLRGIAFWRFFVSRLWLWWLDSLFSTISVVFPVSAGMVKAPQPEAHSCHSCKHEKNIAGLW